MEQRPRNSWWHLFMNNPAFSYLWLGTLLLSFSSFYLLIYVSTLIFEASNSNLKGGAVFAISWILPALLGTANFPHASFDDFFGSMRVFVHGFCVKRSRKGKCPCYKYSPDYHGAISVKHCHGGSLVARSSFIFICCLLF